MWEYTIIEEGNIKKAVQKLNELGKENWEAVGYAQVLKTMHATHVILLKRQK